MTTSKIKIKLGAIEIEYEGSETFLKEELPQLLSAVSELYLKSHGSFGTTIGAPPDTSTGSSESNGVRQKLQATTGTLAARLQVKSGPDLIIAAAAKLTLVDELSTFPRQRLSDEMRTASAYFKANYIGNLSKALHSLIKDGKLNEPSQGVYALTARSLQEVESRIAGS